ncbi:hypothetical protein [Streptomyces sp. NPDC047525]|uniref:hypothetical protein n=1 Tax=Streptomyces sp. NPDC047525 TaxID=3155264 RepID=UPI0033EEC43F
MSEDRITPAAAPQGPDRDRPGVALLATYGPAGLGLALLWLFTQSGPALTSGLVAASAVSSVLGLAVALLLVAVLLPLAAGTVFFVIRAAVYTPVLAVVVPLALASAVRRRRGAGA